MQKNSNNNIFLSQASPDDFAMKTVLLRIDMNVSLGENHQVDRDEAFRLESALPTIKYLMNAGAQVILLGHMGKGKDREKETLRPLLDYFEKALGSCPAWFSDPTTLERGKLHLMLNLGENIILCENLRFWAGEKDNDPDFVKSLVQSADIYVNDAFSVSHRDHASMTGIPQHVPSLLGLHIEKELSTLDSFLEKNEPTLMVIGGAKFGTKLALIQKFLEMGNSVAVVGALAHAIYRARSLPIGQSLVDDTVDVESIVHYEQLLVAQEVVVRDPDGNTRSVAISDVRDGDVIVDAGVSFIHTIENILHKEAITRVLWNGPFGWYEEGFIDASVGFAKILEKNKDNVQSVVGGGDTVTLLRQQNLIDVPGFVSTGGGALLDYLNDGELVAVEAIKNSKNT